MANKFDFLTKKTVKEYIKMHAVWHGKCLFIGNGLNYSRITKNENYCLLHHAAYWAYYGAIPKGQVVMHSCDVKGCVNHFHLKTGTQSQNMLAAWTDEAKTRRLKMPQSKSVTLKISESSCQKAKRLAEKNKRTLKTTIEMAIEAAVAARGE